MAPITPPDPSENGLWAALGTGVILLLGGMYKAFRIVKRDIRDDRSSDLFDKYRDSLVQRIKELEDRLDKLALERNTAVAASSRLEETVKHLSQSLDEVKKNSESDMQKLTEENSNLKTRVDKLLDLLGVESDEELPESLV